MAQISVVPGNPDSLIQLAVDPILEQWAGGGSTP